MNNIATTILEVSTAAMTRLLTTTGSNVMVHHDHSGHSVHDSSEVHVHPQSDHNMADMISVAKEMHWVMSVVIGPILVILGLFGNVFSLIIWNRPGMTSSTGKYLTALAVADSGLLIWFFLVDSVKMMSPQVVNSVAYSAFYAYLGYPIFFLFVVLSIWFMVGVTVDRFIMVCLINKAKEYCSERRANLGIGLIFGLCFLINIPHFWSYRVDYNKGVNGTGPALMATDFGKGDGGVMYEFWVHCIFLVLVPFFSILVLNMFIIKKISSTNKRMSTRKSAGAVDKSRRSENQITRLLLLVTFVFLFLIGFQCISQCFYMLMPEGFDRTIIDEAYAIAKMGVIVNSSTNFILYCMSGRRFRREFFILIGCSKRAALMGSSSGEGSSGTSSTATTGI